MSNKICKCTLAVFITSCIFSIAQCFQIYIAQCFQSGNHLVIILIRNSEIDNLFALVTDLLPVEDKVELKEFVLYCLHCFI
jgi:hypothetical protein